MSNEARTAFISGLSDEEFDALNWFYIFEARDKQLPPLGSWFCWFLRSGRGFGKTRSGSEWVLQCVDDGYKRIALIGQTKADVRDTMIEIESSSIMKVAPDRLRPDYQPSKRRLVWANGAIATVYSGDEPDQLRGPQHDKAWVDELAKFKYPETTWDNMELGLRLGDDPQVLVTTTPRPLAIIKRLLSESSTVDVTGSTFENVDNLSPRFIQRITARYEGTRLGQQELYGEILDDHPNALWSRDILEASRVTDHDDLHRVIVSIDPAASTGQTGIVVVGAANVVGLGHGYIIDDVTTPEGAKPEAWARAAVAAYNKWSADWIVAEVNNGGDMVEQVIRSVPGGSSVAYKTVRATRGKHTRAEPISALFEQGRGHMVGYYTDLEDQLCSWVPGDASPDRLDAMVWAFTALGIIGGEVDWSSVRDLGKIKGFRSKWE